MKKPKLPNNVIALVEKKSDVVPFFKASYVLNTRDNKLYYTILFLFATSYIFVIFLVE